MTKKYLWYAWSVVHQRYYPIGVSPQCRGIFPPDLCFGLSDCHLFSIPIQTSF